MGQSRRRLGRQLGELTEYCKIYGHCNVPQRYSENRKQGNWVNHQRKQHRLHVKGKASHLTSFRIQTLESLGFELDGKCADKGNCAATSNCVAKSNCTAWEDRLSELVDYRKMHGHRNVPNQYSENTKLAHWVNTEKKQYKLHGKGKKSNLTTLRIQELKSLDFEWDSYSAAWEAGLSELADYCKIHGDCNLPRIYSKNIKLDYWVKRQMMQNRLHLKGKTSTMTVPRIQALESLSFE